MNFKQQYDEQLETEIKQFLFLACERDRKLLLARAKESKITEYVESKITEYVRLACICIVFGYRAILLKVLALSEKYFDKFMIELKSVGENFTQIDEWLNDFIKNVQIPEAQKLAREFWQERKATVDGNDFNIRNLFC